MRAKKVILLVRFFCTFCVCLLLFPTIVQAQEPIEKEQEVWTTLARVIVKEVDSGRYLEARQQLEKLANQFSRSDFAQKKLSVQAIQALSTVIIDLEERLNRITPNPTELRFFAKRLLITFDAVDHSFQPLWKTYYAVLKKQSEKLMTDLRKQRDVQDGLSTLQNDYLLIRPALIVVKSSITVQKVDSLFTLLARDKNVIHQLEAVKQLNNLLYPLFYGSEQDVLAAINPNGKVPISTFLFIMSIIIMGILSYVAWRKRGHATT
jgi:sporulation protein YpjB